MFLCTFSKLNTIKDGYSFINVKREDFTVHLMQLLSHHLRKEIPFSPLLWKSTYMYKGR